MKNKLQKAPPAVYFAAITLVLITTFIVINTTVLSSTIKKLKEKAEETPLTANAFESLHEDFLAARTYISISVDHNDIASVEEEFQEILGALAIGDKESAAIAKSRLCGALGHLGRLSGFNIDSII